MRRPHWLLLVVVGCAADEQATGTLCVPTGEWLPFRSGQSWTYARLGPDGTPSDRWLTTMVLPYSSRERVLPGLGLQLWSYPVESVWTCPPEVACDEEPAGWRSWGAGDGGLVLLANQEAESVRYRYSIRYAAGCLAPGTFNANMYWEFPRYPPGGFGVPYTQQVGLTSTLTVSQVACHAASEVDSRECFLLQIPEWDGDPHLSPGPIPSWLQVAEGIGIVAFEDPTGVWTLVASDGGAS